LPKNPPEKMLSLLLGGSPNNPRAKGFNKRLGHVIVIFFAIFFSILCYLHYFTKVDVLAYAAMGGGIFLLFIRDRFFKVEGLNLSAQLMKNAKKSKIS
jgi:hypothetical protein